jgi:hypothetical protein
MRKPGKLVLSLVTSFPTVRCMARRHRGLMRIATSRNTGLRKSQLLDTGFAFRFCSSFRSSRCIRDRCNSIFCIEHAMAGGQNRSNLCGTPDGNSERIGEGRKAIGQENLRILRGKAHGICERLEWTERNSNVGSFTPRLRCLNFTLPTRTASGIRMKASGFGGLDLGFRDGPACFSCNQISAFRAIHSD